MFCNKKIRFDQVKYVATFLDLGLHGMALTLIIFQCPKKCPIGLYITDGRF